MGVQGSSVCRFQFVLTAKDRTKNMWKYRDCSSGRLRDVEDGTPYFPYLRGQENVNSESWAEADMGLALMNMS